MMDGYVVFDEDDDLVVRFGSWGNKNGNEGGSIVGEDLEVNMREGWSIGEVYESGMEKEEEVSHVGYMRRVGG
ncbi:hypothetical protein [Staphylococcus pettenkoferi]|uniref:hypothetical protein n=1 Tax=Staphylococcus pettenkoferi TaxID=170573 RepID=UPI0011A18697|nr:hypothetical protein [Staphylococcus pettenkoferi]